MRRQITSLTLLFGLIFSQATSIAPALAATAPAATPAKPSPAGQALEIAPPVISLSVNPGQTIKTVIYLRNISGTNLIVSNQVNDFVASGQDGTPKLLLKDTDTSPYSLKTWVSPLPNLNLVPKEIKTLNVSINVPASASPGGHYGVVRFTGTPAGLDTNGVSLSASLGSLILVTVSGDVKENLSVQEFSASHEGQKGSVFEAAPVEFTEIFKNTGNVHLKPVGQVEVTNMFGKKIGAVNVNVPPGNILPQSSRKFKQPLDKTVLGSKRLFGHYTAKLNISYGSNKQVLTSSLGFWVIPYRLIIVVAVLLVGAFFGLRYLLKWYNRRVIERANRDRQL